MSVHDAVSCDACMKSSFSGNRYKCLICYDFDLCANCYEAGATSAQHLMHHPMQCVLASADCDLYYAGEEQSQIHVPRSFTCPFCGRMGFSDTTLNTHVTNEHADDCFEVVCPVCAATPGGDPNRMTDDFVVHLMMEHRGTTHDFDEAQGLVRTSTDQQTTHRAIASGMQTLGRVHHEAYHYHSPGSTISSLAPGGGGQDSETIESVSELLYQLTAIKGRESTIQNLSSQLQQLELQLQTTRHQLEGFPVRQSQHTASRQRGTGERSRVIVLTQGSASSAQVQGGSGGTRSQNPELKDKSQTQYLLARLDESAVSEPVQEQAEAECADKAVFIQELLLTVLVEGLTSESNTSKQEAPKTVHDSSVTKCNPPVPSSGHQLSSTCDRKPASMTNKEIMTRDISSGLGSIVTPHQSLDRVESHPQKTRFHHLQKVSKNKNGKDPLPPRK